MLDTRKGEALLAVIDTGSFDQAATQLHLTTSAISQRISAMEAELGAPLVVRAKPCRATREGEQLIQYLRRARLLEDEFMAGRTGDGGETLTVALAVNNDTLATWLLPGLANFLAAENVVLDITLDDQDHTYELLSQGVALAGVSSNPKPMRGCRAEPLGAMRYRMLAAPVFAERWFPHGLERQAARQAPMMGFNRKDKLQAEFLQRELGLPPGSYPCHYVPATDPFMHAIELGIGYGLLPALQYGSRVQDGSLIDLAPGKSIDVALFWHAWRVQSPKMERLSERVIAAARAMLSQN
jgi:LysR family transcriptional regulator (chromosome initiation inhibitor)